MDTELRLALLAYLGAQRRFRDCLRAYKQCKRNCRFGGRWPKLTRDAKRSYFSAARVLRGAMERYYNLKRSLKAA